MKNAKENYKHKKRKKLELELSCGEFLSNKCPSFPRRKIPAPSAKLSRQVNWPEELPERTLSGIKYIQAVVVRDFISLGLSVLF
jgi:hypothetical protein